MEEITRPFTDALPTHFALYKEGKPDEVDKQILPSELKGYTTDQEFPFRPTFFKILQTIDLCDQAHAAAYYLHKVGPALKEAFPKEDQDFVDKVQSAAIEFITGRARVLIFPDKGHRDVDALESLHLLCQLTVGKSSMRTLLSPALLNRLRSYDDGTRVANILLNPHQTWACKKAAILKKKEEVKVETKPPPRKNGHTNNGSLLRTVLLKNARDSGEKLPPENTKE